MHEIFIVSFWTQFCHWYRCSVLSPEAIHPSVTKTSEHLFFVNTVEISTDLGMSDIFRCTRHRHMTHLNGYWLLKSELTEHSVWIRNVWASLGFFQRQTNIYPFLPHAVYRGVFHPPSTAEHAALIVLYQAEMSPNLMPCHDSRVLLVFSNPWMNDVWHFYKVNNGRNGLRQYSYKSHGSVLLRLQ